MSDYEAERGVDLGVDTERFAAREDVGEMLAPWFSAHTLAEARTLLDAGRVCWGPYQNFEQLVAEDPRCSAENPLFDFIEHPGIGATLTPRGPVDVEAGEVVPPRVTPLLGQHTDEVLLDLLHVSEGELAGLHDRNIVAGPDR